MYIIHFYGSGFTTLIRFNYWILCETVLPGQGGVPRLAEVDFTDTDTDSVTPYMHCLVCHVPFFTQGTGSFSEYLSATSDISSEILAFLAALYITILVRTFGVVLFITLAVLTVILLLSASLCQEPIYR
jgi:hypothetical protein